MGTELNINEIAGHAASDLIESFFTSIGEASKEHIAKSKIRFGKGFSKYLDETLQRYSMFKNLINRHDAVNLGEYYVPSSIRDSSSIYRSDDFLAVLQEKKRFIVEGTAGLGKTLFVRSLLRHAILDGQTYIPILFELRHLHLDNRLSLLENLTHQISQYVKGFNVDHLRFGLERGKFIIFLDGIDEIAVKDRTRYASEILDLSYRYTETPILLSTRPDDFYLAWESFRIATLLPMTHPQTLLMLSKLDFDNEIKQAFIATITEAYFKKHSEFLSVPLLATLMMMTFSEFSAVPNSMHVFYEQAYQTLFHKHDFIKGAFSRKIESGLDVERFRLVLSAFCFISYLQQNFSFLDFQVVEDINAALSLTSTIADNEAFLKDLLVTVCLLQRDGNQMTFIHRSFQEYFAALFISKIAPSDVFDIMEELLSRSKTDSVLGMIAKLNDALFEKEWVLPKLQKFQRVLDKHSTDIALIESALGKPVFDQGLIFQRYSEGEQNFFRILFEMYSNSSRTVDDVYADDSLLISKYIDEQQALAEKEQPHNRSVLGARKRVLQGSHFNIYALPGSLIARLRCVQEAATDLRKLPAIKEKLEKKHNGRGQSIRNLLSKYKK